MNDATIHAQSFHLSGLLHFDLCEMFCPIKMWSRYDKTLLRFDVEEANGIKKTVFCISGKNIWTPCSVVFTTHFQSFTKGNNFSI